MVSWVLRRVHLEAHSVVHAGALAVHKLLQTWRCIIQAEAYDLQATVPVLLCDPGQVWEHLPAWAAPAPRDADMSYHCYANAQPPVTSNASVS